MRSNSLIFYFTCLAQHVIGLNQGKATLRYQVRQSRLLVESRKQTTEEDFDIPMESITDEEALLACRAFLQRKNKLGWKQHKRRKRKLGNSLALSSTADEGAGYFWEDPTELKYLFTGRPRLSFESADLLGDLQLNDEDFLDIQSREEEDEDEEVKDSLIIEENDGEYFTGFPAFPPDSFATRSKNKKDLFRDKAWKAKWYKARWGNCSDERAELRKAKRIESYIQQIPSEILRSPELAALSDDDIEDAIRTYIIANKKRSNSQKKCVERKRNMRHRKPPNEDEYKISKSLPTLDSFIAHLEDNPPKKNELIRRQRERSLRASKSYQTRLKNSSSKAQGKAINVTSTVNTPWTTARVDGAVIRIKTAIDKKSYPIRDDIDIILEPKRLAGRKDLLKEVLLNCFGLRGKCIPDLKLSHDDLEEFYRFNSIDHVNEFNTKFATKSSIYELGCFIIFRLKQVVDQ